MYCVIYRTRLRTNCSSTCRRHVRVRGRMRVRLAWDKRAESTHGGFRTAETSVLYKYDTGVRRKVTFSVFFQTEQFNPEIHQRATRRWTERLTNAHNLSMLEFGDSHTLRRLHLALSQFLDLVTFKSWPIGERFVIHFLNIIPVFEGILPLLRARWHSIGHGSSGKFR